MVFTLLTALVLVAASVCATEYTDNNANEFLMKYGYESGQTIFGSEDQTIAIKKMQKFAALPQTGVLDDATVKKMNSPRCGISDNGPSRLGVLWTKKHLRYRFENFSPDIGEAATRSMIKGALKMWSDVTPLTFSEATDKNNYDITIRFEGGKHGNCRESFDGKGFVLAHAFFPQDGRVHFDEDEDFVVPGKTTLRAGQIDILWVAAHEFGHTLGLEHSDVWGALMFPYYKGGTMPDLHSDDIYRIQVYYGTTDPCVFPFIYNGRKYGACASPNGKAWCASTSNYDTNKRKWKHCDGSEPKQCILPFIHNGQSRDSCLPMGDGKQWCATTSNYDLDKAWIHCVPTHGGNAVGAPCVFPFTLQGKSHSKCIARGSSTWCSTTSNYDQDKTWGECPATKTTKTTVYELVGVGGCVQLPRTQKYSFHRKVIQTLPQCQAACNVATNCDAVEFKTGRCAGLVNEDGKGFFVLPTGGTDQGTKCWKKKSCTKIRDGWCNGGNMISIVAREGSTEKKCREACLQNPDCGSFVLGKLKDGWASQWNPKGHCSLYKKGSDKTCTSGGRHYENVYELHARQCLAA